MATEDSSELVWALVGRETVRPDDKPHVIGRLQRLCRAAATDIPASGVGVSVIGEDGDQVSVAASSRVNEKIEELQFVLGEGPCLSAFHSRSPVLTPNLGVAAQTRWPGYGAAAQEFGVRAVFAFPLQVGAIRLGALDVYRSRTGRLEHRALSQASAFAEAAMRLLLYTEHDLPVARVGESPVANAALEDRLEVYQAQGMVMVQLGVSLQEAMSRLRAYAFAHDRRINDVAADVVARRLSFDEDGR